MNVAINLKTRWTADTGLVIAASFWGFDTILIKLTIVTFPPLFYLGIRFLLAGAIMSVLFWPKITSLGKSAWFWTCLAGTLLFGGFALQTVGLRYTTPGISAFLTMTYFMFAPIFKSLISRKLPESKLIAGILLVAVGMWLLFFQNRFVFGLGESLTLLSAVLFAMHILVVDKAVNLVNSVALATIQVSVTGFLSIILALILEPFPREFTSLSVLTIGFGILFGSIGAYLLQTGAQKLTPPSHVGLLLSLEAIFALLFSVLFGLDVLTRNGILGLALVFLGTILAEWTRPQKTPAGNKA
ncbi:EamA domain protein [Acididesulfobacillus acetoxydans]|uniref:Drug/metabolite transporter n=1 Tax=Acididesulfobacillus acetoxydans TaxID=1561005 RepID=A0A8S0WII2_9FIRM|nr:DMT family transporter [Acididesulfobacillus acetoxydans]CAA7603362.1 EamA domain protein [Acididesulfobacillus acetoxydans]CEJ09309.1 Drug/metabolite transporter [Acididesulfobacillus acetoxydans]